MSVFGGAGTGTGNGKTTISNVGAGVAGSGSRGLFANLNKSDRALFPDVHS